MLISCELSFIAAVLPGRVQASVILHEIVMDCGSVAVLEQRHEHDQQEQADADTLRHGKARCVLENGSHKNQRGNRYDADNQGLDETAAIVVHVQVA